MIDEQIKTLKQKGLTRTICQIDILYDEDGHRCGMAHIVKTENDLELLALLGYIKTIEHLTIDDLNYPYEEEEK